MSGGAPSLFFVTPVYRRFALTRICLEQRRWACDQIAERYGYAASCIVVGDDRNLDTAREYGFETVEQTNEWLGRKFNDGYQHAIQEHGATHVFAIGSDVFVDPAYFAVLPDPGTVRISRHYTVFPPTGDRRGEMLLTNECGVSFIWPAQMIEGRGRRKYRPCEDKLARGCDTSTWITARPKSLEYREDGHPLELVSFQSARTQITDYARLLRRWGVREVVDGPFDDLPGIYPAGLVDQVRAYYRAGTDTREDG